MAHETDPHPPATIHNDKWSLKAWLVLSVLLAVGYGVGINGARPMKIEPAEFFVAITMGLLGGSFFYGPYFLIKRWLHRAIEHRAQSAAINQTAEALQEGLDKDFFTNLVKINFKYIDKYYLQTQVQADKSFYLSAIASCVSLLVILIGISILFFTKRDAHASAHAAGYVAAVAGTLGQFIAAVFFYLYTQTITEMREYHQKLVLTQNLSLALKITEELPPAEQVAVRTRLIDYLAKDINTFLTAKPADTNPRNNSSNIPPAVAPQMELPTGRQTSL